MIGSTPSMNGVNMKIYETYRLAIKYWLQGDDWKDAVIYAKRIIDGFR
jgi:hypothetical protein